MKVYPRHCGLRMSDECCRLLVKIVRRVDCGIMPSSSCLRPMAYVRERLPRCGLKTLTGSGTSFTCDTRKPGGTRACLYCGNLAKRSSRTSKVRDRRLGCERYSFVCRRRCGRSGTVQP